MTPRRFLPFFVILFLSLSLRSFAQFRLFSDPVTRSLGGVQTVLSGLSATTGNPSGIYTLTDTQIRLYIQNHFSAIGLQESGIQWGSSFRFGYGGLSVQQLGYQDYRLQSVRIAIAKKVLKNLYVGGSMGTGIESVRGYGSQFSILSVIGLFYHVSSTLSIGAHGHRGTESNNALHLGIRYQPTTSLQLVAESSISGIIGWKLRTGVAYYPLPVMSFRIGIEAPEPQFSFGTGFLIYTFAQLDLALRQHPLLGTSVALGITFYPNRLNL